MSLIWRWLDEDDTGFTLVELLIAVTLLAILSSVFLGGIVSAFRGSETAHARIETLQALQLTMENVSREIRAANSHDTVQAAVRTANASTVQFDVFRAQDPLAAPVALRRIRFSYTVTGTTLMEQRDVWDDAATVPADANRSSTSQRTLVTNLTDLSTKPVFRFRDRNGAPMASTVLDADRKDVAEVVLTLRRDVGGGRGPIETETRIALRNL